jgi:hypothetical protein
MAAGLAVVAAGSAVMAAGLAVMAAGLAVVAAGSAGIAATAGTATTVEIVCVVPCRQRHLRPWTAIADAPLPIGRRR